MNILLTVLCILLLDLLQVYCYRLKYPRLRISSAAKRIILKPTIGKISSFDSIATSNGTDKTGIQSIPLNLPNTLSLNGKFDHSWPVLGVDLGTQNLGLSFSYNGEFELFKSIKFVTHRNLTARLLGLIRYLNHKYLLDRLVVAIGFPFLPPSSSGVSNGLEVADLKMLFQIMYTLDFSYYLSHYIVRVFNKAAASENEAISSSDHSTVSHPSNTVTTHCLYCSIFNTNGSITGGSSISCAVDSNRMDKTVQSMCRINGKSCLQTVNLAKMDHLVVGVSEHLSTYQTSSLTSTINTTSGRVNRAEGFRTSLEDENHKFLNKHSLSSLNIYYNLLSTHSNNTSNTTIGTNPTLSGCSGPFLVLPNRTNIFNAKSKHNNILLYRRIKAHLLSDASGK